jgi:cell shape-determining protein MreD
MNLLKVLIRLLFITIIGEIFVYIFESTLQFSQITWIIIGVVWTLCFIPWILWPILREN